MAELSATLVGVVSVEATPAALDALSVRRTTSIRTAPDELLLLTPPGAPEVIVAETRSSIDAEDADATILDVSDGWTMWTVGGTGSRSIFERLSALRVPDHGFVQGEVLHLPAKVVVEDDALHLLVASMWGAYLRERILDRGASLGIVESGSVEWSAT